jgi:uncharacterized protein
MAGSVAPNRAVKNSADDHIFMECIADLILHEQVLSMKSFTHHSTISCFEHCFHVAHVSYKICRKLRIDYRSAARGALLHDFFLYDWHVTKLEKGLHGFRHAHFALQNANLHFSLNDLEKEIIRKHMWPLNIVPPRHIESFVVVFADKYCTVIEVLRIGEKKRRRRLESLVQEHTHGGVICP